MKKVSLYLLLATSTLFARENPFAPTDAYSEEIARLMEREEQHPEEFYLKNNKNTKYENMNSSFQMQQKEPKFKITMVPNKMQDNSKEMQKMQKMQAMQKMHKMQDMQKMQDMLAKKSMKKKMNEQIIYVKKRDDIPDMKKEYNPLDFLKIAYTNNTININSGKYKVFKKFNFEKKKKIILDFRANNLKFYTKRKDLETKSFKNITIGNHKDENYFRVVIQLNETPNNFSVTYTKNLVSISRN